MMDGKPLHFTDGIIGKTGNARRGYMVEPVWAMTILAGIVVGC
jgi:hypothetical protein